MLGRFFLILALLFIAANAVHPRHHRPIGITQKFGVADVFCFIPGITKEGVCQTCTQVLSAVKGQATGGLQQGTNFLNSFVSQGCSTIVSALSPLGLTTLGPFCQEVGGRLLSFVSSSAQIPLSFINPRFDCQIATFC